MPCSAKQGGLRVQDHPDGDILEQWPHAALCGEGVHEPGLPEFRDDLRRNAASQVYPACCHELEGQVSRFSAVERHEEIERLDAQRALSLEGQL